PDRLVVAEHADGRPPPVDAPVIVNGRSGRGRGWVRERVHHREFRVSGSGFFQVHPRAATVLVDAVLALLDLRPGQRVVDLYAGVGLFSAFLGEAVAPNGSVTTVEGNR